MTRLRVFAAAVTAVLLVSGPSVARAQGFEVGSSLAGVFVGLGDDNDVTTVGIPSAGFGVIDSGAYVSFFLGSKFSLEPHIGLLWVSAEGESNHMLNFSGQANLFLQGLDRPSLYLFGTGGIVDTSGDGDSPKLVGGGLGYRIPVGDHLAFRIDGRYVHATDDGGNQLLFAVSIGGVFGK